MVAAQGSRRVQDLESGGVVRKRAKGGFRVAHCVLVVRHYALASLWGAFVEFETWPRDVNRRIYSKHTLRSV